MLSSVAVEVTTTFSLIFGEVKVLFVKVCVPVRVTSPAEVENPGSTTPVLVATPSK